MTREEAAAHWRKGAHDSLELAELARQSGKYALALFHAHLAVEKALKGAFIEEKDSAPPATHDLFEIARGLKRSWEQEKREEFDALSDLAILSRYGDEEWEERAATNESSRHWIDRAAYYLSFLCP